MLQYLFCTFGKHAIARDRVWFDGVDYRTKCRCCARALHRGDKGWTKARPEVLGDSHRLPHPRER
ncbi:hypothetical protein [Alteraurantiacibacter aquimixticola]|uniref:Uncharacterized protein n=1 Tax=Alteraurantiacibacter aquimixticola TaxID=2489173 RepID=A0A4T3EZX0_9SPHN|nr:hypothetical protein [Alteraurantiacibacter aquimixticola]TIX50332.1 hypothetical protein E5222_08610 [Alteraurantiacibacter aquimixticola]